MNLQIAAFSDWRVQPFEPLLRELKKRPVDLCLYAGDDVYRFGAIDYNAFWDDWRTNPTPIPTIFSPWEILITHKKATRSQFRAYVGNLLRKTRQKYNYATPQFLHTGKVVKRIHNIKSCYKFQSPKRKNKCIFYWHKDFKKVQMTEQIAEIAQFGLAGVIGNDCSPIDHYRLMGLKATNLFYQPLLIGDFGIMGLSGAPEGGPGIFLYKEQDALEHLKKQWTFLNKMGAQRIIIVSHAPPYEVLDYSYRFGTHHIGSHAVRQFIEDYEVDLVICGHSHLNGGKKTELGRTTIVNIASHDYLRAPGRLAWISITSQGNVDVELLETFPYSDSELLQLPQVGPNASKLLRS